MYSKGFVRGRGFGAGGGDWGLVMQGEKRAVLTAEDAGAKDED